MTCSILVDVVNALVDALQGPSTGAFSPLAILARPMYPMREFCPQVTPDKTVICRVAKWGRHYKNRGKRPKKVPPADTEGIKTALNLRLPASIRVDAVLDEGDYIIIILGGNGTWKK